MEFIFQVPSKVMFARGASEDINQYLDGEDIKKVLCLYDPGVKKAGIVDPIVEKLHDAGKQVIEYGNVVSDPPVDLIDEVAGLARSEKVEGVIGIGGGSTMDTAKCVNALLGNPGKIMDYSADYDMVKHHGKYLILIPTTFGTGSEVTDGGVLSVPEKRKKISIWGKNLGADLAVIDPDLALGIPASITAATGMDALAHATESYLSMIATPITEALSLQAIRLILNYLPKAVADGKNIENREGMCLGCLTAGLAFNNAFQNQGHGMAHPMGAYWHLPHGVACAIALPFAVRDNVHAMPEKVRNVGRLFGLEFADDISEDEIGKAVEIRIREFAASIGIPNLKELGIDPELIPTVAEAMKEEPDQYTYPHVPETEDVIAFLKANYEGN